MTPRRLPPLPGGPFSLEVARARGLADHDWRDVRLRRVTRGVRSLHDPVDQHERARAFALALPADCAFSHVTAARLWGIPLPSALERENGLDVIRATGRALIERSGCRGHHGLERREVREVHGLRVTSLADTWVDLAAVRPRPPSREDLVVAGDAVVTRWAPPGTSRTAVEVAEAVSPLRRTLESRGSPRGSRLLTQALDLVRPGVRSAMESRSRLMFVAAGFPEPEPCAPVHGTEGGWLAEGDLVWRTHRVIAEYQGSVHAGIRQRSADGYRNGLLADEGWMVHEVFSEDLAQSHRRVALLCRVARSLHLDRSALTIT